MKKYIVLLFSFLLLPLFFNATFVAPEINLAKRHWPGADLCNTTGAQVNKTQLMWFETYNPLVSTEGQATWDSKKAFGVQTSDGWFYLWDVTDGLIKSSCGSGKTIYTKPVCSSYLLNRSGAKVVGSALTFLGMADLEGNGKRDYLIGIQGNNSTNWALAWKIDPATCNGGLRPSFDAPLMNYGKTVIPGNWLSRVVIGDFNNDGKDDLRALQAGTNWNYTWQFNTSLKSISLLHSSPLMDLNDSPVNVDDLTFVDAAGLDGSGQNKAAKTVLAAIHKNGLSYQWELSSRPSTQTSFCKSSTACQGKTLIFSIDQGFINGLPRYDVTQGVAKEAMDRVLLSLKEFQKKYKVYALINPIMDKASLIRFLDILKQNKIPFYLDVQSSDTKTVGLNQKSSTKIANVKYGVGPFISGINQGAISLDEIHARYKEWFAGMRLFELASHEYAERLTCPGDHAFCANDMVTDDFFSLSIIEQFVIYAKSNGKRILLSDQMWVAPWDDNRRWDEDDTIYRIRYGASDLTNKYPNIITPTYNNNEAYGNITRSGLHRMDDWARYINYKNSNGIALSNQSWLCARKPGFNDNNCPPEYMMMWTADALVKNNAEIVQFEPFWYLFAWQSGQLTDVVPALAANGTRTVPPANGSSGYGAPTSNLCMLADGLGVKLSLCP